MQFREGLEFKMVWYTFVHQFREALLSIYQCVIKSVWMTNMGSAFATVNDSETGCDHISNR